MILAIDVQYSENTAFVAGITFGTWLSEAPENEYISVFNDVAEYEPGNFYKRDEATKHEID